MYPNHGVHVHGSDEQPISLELSIIFVIDTGFFLYERYDGSRDSGVPQPINPKFS